MSKSNISDKKISRKWWLSKENKTIFQVRLLYEELDSLYNTRYSPNYSIPKFPAVINDARNGYHVTDL